MGVNVLRLSGFPFTVTKQDGAGASGTVENTYDGDDATYYGHYVGTDSESSSGTSDYSWIKYTFTNPITITRIRVKGDGYGRGGNSTLKILLDNVEVSSLTTSGEGIYVDKTDTAVHPSVTEVWWQIYSSASGNRNENPRISRSYFYEIEIEASSGDYGGVMC